MNLNRIAVFRIAVFGALAHVKVLSATGFRYPTGRALDLQIAAVHVAAQQQRLVFANMVALT